MAKDTRDTKDKRREVKKKIAKKYQSTVLIL